MYKGKIDIKIDKKLKENKSTEIVCANPEFKKSLLDTILRIKSGKIKWHKYKKIAKEVAVYQTGK